MTTHKPDYPFCLFSIKPDGARVIREVTNSCNYSCDYCIFSSARGNTQFDVDTQQMKDTLDQLRSHGVKYLKITGGEPFSRPDLIEILWHAHDLGFKIDISTNASFLKQEYIDQLKQMRIEYIHISLDGFDKLTQEIVRGKNTFEPTIRGIKKVVAAGLPVRVGTVIYSGNQNHLEDIVQCVSGLGVQHIIFSFMEPVGRMHGHDDSQLISTLTQQQATNILSDIQTKYRDTIKVEYSFIEKQQSGCGSCKTCPGGKEFLFLDHKGRLSPCTWISEYFPQFISKDTLHTTGFDKLISGDAMQNYFSVIQTLQKYGISGCPKSHLGLVSDLRNMQVFFAKPDRLDQMMHKFGKMGGLYAHTTENLSYLSGFDNRGHIAAISGSGDHVFDLYLHGSDHITAVDLNQFAGYWLDLKRQMVLHLEYHEFIKRIDRTSQSPLAHNLYTEVRGKLQPLTQFFRDTLYEKFEHNGKKIRLSNVFRYEYQKLSDKLIHVSYLSSLEKYQKLQNILHTKMMEFINTNIQNYQPKKQLDGLILGNWSDYWQSENLVDWYTQTLLPQLVSKIKPGGQIQTAYVYGVDQDSTRSVIDDPEIRKVMFQNHEIMQLPSALSTGGVDEVAVYHVIGP